MAVDMFLKLTPEVKGAATQDKHKDWIEVQSWSWGVANQGSDAQKSAASRAGMASASDLNFTKFSDKSTPVLVESCAAGKSYDKAELECLTGAGTGDVYMKITLEKVFISSYNVGGSNGAGTATESLALAYKVAKVDFNVADPLTGKMAAGPKTAFDFAAQKKV